MYPQLKEEETEAHWSRGSLSLLDQFKVSEAVGSRGRNQIRVASVTQVSTIARTPKKSLVCIKCVPAFLEFHSIGTQTETEGKNLAHVGKERTLDFVFIDKITSSFKLFFSSYKTCWTRFQNEWSWKQNKAEQNNALAQACFFLENSRSLIYGQCFHFPMLPFRVDVATFSNLSFPFLWHCRNVSHFFFRGLCLPIWHSQEALCSNLLSLRGEGGYACCHHIQKCDCVHVFSFVAAVAQSGCPVPWAPRASKITYFGTHTCVPSKNTDIHL